MLAEYCSIALAEFAAAALFAAVRSEASAERSAAAAVRSAALAERSDALAALVA